MLSSFTEVYGQLPVSRSFHFDLEKKAKINAPSNSTLQLFVYQIIVNEILEYMYQVSYPYTTEQDYKKRKGNGMHYKSTNSIS